MFFLSLFLYTFVYLYLGACNSLPISRVHNTANIAAHSANFSIASINARFPEQICKKPLYNPPYAHIQKKTMEIYADVLTRETIPTRVLEIQGIMPEIRKYAYKLCEYILAMKIALEQPSLVANSNWLYIAQSILHYSTFILDTNNLTNYIHTILHHVAPTIKKSYSRHMADFLLNHADAIPAYHHARDDIMDMLQSILRYAYATIDKLDTEYYDTDVVFFTIDPFESLRNNAYNAFKKATEANKKGQNAWKSLTYPSPLQALKKSFHYNLKARNAAEKASKAYRNLAKYFDQFIPSIQTMLNSVNVLIYTAQLTVNSSYTSYLRTCLDHIRITKSDIQEALDRLTDMIWKAHQAANQYNNSCTAYSTWIDDMKKTICRYMTDQYITNQWIQLKE